MKLKLAPAPAPIDGDAMLGVLAAQLAKLVARDKVLLEEQIGLEKSSGGGNVVDVWKDQAEALLEGQAFTPRRDLRMSQLEAILAERKTIARALQIGRSQQHELMVERAGRIFVEFFEEIAELETKRVATALRLQRLNRERETLREKIGRAGGQGVLPTDSAALLELGDRVDEVRWCVERLVADRIATEAELTKLANADG